MCPLMMASSSLVVAGIDPTVPAKDMRVTENLANSAYRSGAATKFYFQPLPTQS
jgi:hypothetical protein